MSDIKQLKEIIKATGAFGSRSEVKNFIILRHIFESLRDEFGPWDGFDRGKNRIYSGFGRPRVFLGKNGQVEWYDRLKLYQTQIVNLDYISEKEKISASSVQMWINWCLTVQEYVPEKKTFAFKMVATSRRSAGIAYWLLTKDLIKLEKCNFDNVNWKTLI